MKNLDLAFTIGYYKSKEKYVARIVGVDENMFEISNPNLDHLKEEVRFLLPQMLPTVIGDVSEAVEFETFNIEFDEE